MDNDRYFYISGYEKHEVRRWWLGDTNGALVAGGHGEGNRLNQLNSPDHIFVDQDYSVYISDENNHRVMKWIKGAREGIVVAGGTVYVADCDNNRVMRWSKEDKQAIVIVDGNNQAEQPNQFHYSQGLSFDRHGYLYVDDFDNDRIQRFNIDPRSS
ncbi:unnamed protein product [Rotaria sp. Silwood2]|nr:unnamed protein product [Rotaria sp. Silwood2]CAF3178062.1 unnamed protein product [Rotaria sp. Silwood2]CAF3265853.1 unnamed protein product [Rotaria sp. Silwood2]CAF3991229.1 unnamed protein product [Rotaria sp. Silwood2]CAF4105255.1 unnamed protein product [Rotaria sp. Silwood2]